MTASEELIAAVRARLEASPYRLTVTDRGFDVDVDLTDATWTTLMQRRRVSEYWTYRVELDEPARTLTITDDVRALTWKVGVESNGGLPVPVVGGSVSRRVGRWEHKAFRKTIAVTPQGPQTVEDFSFDSAEGRRHVREPARELGWTEEMGTAQRVGLVFAIIGGVGALVTVVVLVVLLVLL